MRRDVGATIRVAEGPIDGEVEDVADVDTVGLRKAFSRSCFRREAVFVLKSGGSGSFAVCIRALSMIVFPIPTTKEFVRRINGQKVKNTYSLEFQVHMFRH